MPVFPEERIFQILISLFLSFMVISLISELEDQFQIEIDASEIIPENLNSVNAMWRMITKLQES